MQLVRRMVVAAAEYPPTQTHSRPQAQAMVSAHPRRVAAPTAELHSSLPVMNMTLLSSVLTPHCRTTAHCKGCHN